MARNPASPIYSGKAGSPALHCRHQGNLQRRGHAETLLSQAQEEKKRRVAADLHPQDVSGCRPLLWRCVPVMIGSCTFVYYSSNCNLFVDEIFLLSAVARQVGAGRA